MSRPRGERKAAEPRSVAARNRAVRMSDACFDAWVFWKGQMKMSYEESMWYFLKHCPIEITVPDGIEVRSGKAAVKKEKR